MKEEEQERKMEEYEATKESGRDKGGEGTEGRAETERWFKIAGG